MSIEEQRENTKSLREQLINSDVIADLEMLLQLHIQDIVPLLPNEVNFISNQKLIIGINWWAAGLTNHIWKE
jgi:hypothetical protein